MTKESWDAFKLTMRIGNPTLYNCVADLREQVVALQAESKRLWHAISRVQDNKHTETVDQIETVLKENQGLREQLRDANILVSTLRMKLDGCESIIGSLGISVEEYQKYTKGFAYKPKDKPPY